MDCDCCGKHVGNYHIEPFNFSKKIKILCMDCWDKKIVGK